MAAKVASIFEHSFLAFLSALLCSSVKVTAVRLCCSHQNVYSRLHAGWGMHPVDGVCPSCIVCASHTAWAWLASVCSPAVRPHLSLTLPPCPLLLLLLSVSPVVSVLWSSLFSPLPGLCFTIIPFILHDIVICLLYQESVLLCTIDWLQTQLCSLGCFHTHSIISASVPQALRLQGCTVMPIGCSSLFPCLRLCWLDCSFKFIFQRPQWPLSQFPCQIYYPSPLLNGHWTKYWNTDVRDLWPVFTKFTHSRRK